MFYIKYHTGVEDETAETLQEAMDIADDGACYTQEDITIEDDAGNVVATRYWNGVKWSEDEDDDCVGDVIPFGDFGYYTGWYIC